MIDGGFGTGTAGNRMHELSLSHEGEDQRRTMPKMPEADMACMVMYILIRA
jgi:hypothetical protein